MIWLGGYFHLNKEHLFAYNTNKRSYLEMILVEKYIGRTVEIIYVDRTGKITQRRIEVHDVRGGLVRAICLTSHAPRAFRIDNILACVPVAKGRHTAS